ncbi:MAG TPA: hypothetical protein VN193_02860 [Candidatus Angelobacter sp.]|jgi:hypothetical protein|nr:hypothetical protein [Candidatus Angelobacter sp.]
MATPTRPLTMLDHVEIAVRHLAERPDAPGVDGRLLGADLPQRPVPLRELRALLLQPTTSYRTRDDVLRWVADQARDDLEEWGLAFTWLLVPGLRRAVARLVCAGADPVESSSEVVAALLGALADRALPPRGIAASLCWHAYRQARRALRIGEVRPLSLDRLIVPVAAPPASLRANPEEVLIALVHAGALAAADAELVAASRLEKRELAALAPAFGVGGDSLQKRRVRAEGRLTAVLDASVRSGAPARGRLGVRWARALERRDANSAAALSYRPRPGARLGVARPESVRAAHLATEPRAA